MGKNQENKSPWMSYSFRVCGLTLEDGVKKLTDLRWFSNKMFSMLVKERIMSSVTSLSLPVHFDPNTMYFDQSMYEKADSAFRTCKYRVDSSSEVERKCSIAATNMIIYLINEFICKPLGKIEGYANGASECDKGSCEKIKQIAQHFFSKSSTYLDRVDKDEMRIENWKRAQNILRSFYRTEIRFLGKFIEKRKILRTRDHLESLTDSVYLFTMFPGSLADAIGCEVRLRLRKEVSVNAGHFSS
jgi:hypothetical protein